MEMARNNKNTVHMINTMLEGEKWWPKRGEKRERSEREKANHVFIVDCCEVEIRPSSDSRKTVFIQLVESILASHPPTAQLLDLFPPGGSIVSSPDKLSSLSRSRFLSCFSFPESQPSS
jgi:hypothetical protein